MQGLQVRTVRRHLLESSSQRPGPSSWPVQNNVVSLLECDNHCQDRPLTFSRSFFSFSFSFFERTFGPSPSSSTSSVLSVGFAVVGLGSGVDLAFGASTAAATCHTILMRYRRLVIWRTKPTWPFSLVFVCLCFALSCLALLSLLSLRLRRSPLLVSKIIRSHLNGFLGLLRLIFVHFIPIPKGYCSILAALLSLLLVLLPFRLCGLDRGLNVI